MREAGDVCYTDVYKDGTGVVEFMRYEDMTYAARKLDDSKFRSHEGETSYIRVKMDSKYGPSSGSGLASGTSADYVVLIHFISLHFTRFSSISPPLSLPLSLHPLSPFSPSRFRLLSSPLSLSGMRGSAVTLAPGVVPRVAGALPVTLHVALALARAKPFMHSSLSQNGS